jgi:UDP-glucose 4-epimerase
MDRTVLITGVAGFIGRYAAQHFSSEGWSVIGIDHASPENAPLSSLSAYYNLHLPNNAFRNLLQKHSPDVLIHCAGRSSVGFSITEPSSDFYDSTVLGFEILNSLRLHAPRCRFIFLSSAAVYGNPESLPVKETHLPSPISPYGFHKWQCEQLCLEFSKIYGMSTASLRLFSAYGPGLRRQVLWDICQKILVHKSLLLQGTGKESRDFIHAIDIAKASRIVAANAPMQGEVYNVGSGQEVAIEELTRMILAATESKLFPHYDGTVPPGTPMNWQADISKLESLGFTPSIPFAQGVTSFVSWCHAELFGI